MVSWEKLKDLKPPDAPPDPVLLREIERRITWKYPLADLGRVPAKLTVGEMVERFLADDEERWVAAVDRPIRADVPALEGGSGSAPRRSRDLRETAVARGIAVHRFLAGMDLGIEPGEAEVGAEIRRLMFAGVLSPEESSLIDAGMVADFLKSPLGTFLRTNRDKVKREVPFTIRVPAELFMRGSRSEVDAGCARTQEPDYVVVQGTIDVLVCAGDGLHIVDYKTDRAGPEELDALLEAYAPQVSLYALAAESILGRPVVSARLAFLHAREVREVPFRELLDAREIRLLPTGVP